MTTLRLTIAVVIFWAAAANAAIQGWNISSSMNRGADSSWTIDSTRVYVVTGTSNNLTKADTMRADTIPGHASPSYNVNFNRHGYIPNASPYVAGGYAPAVKVFWYLKSGGLPFEVVDNSPTVSPYVAQADTVNAGLPVNVTQMNGSGTPVGNLADAFDGSATSNATMLLRKLRIVNTTNGDTALVVSNTSTGAAKPAAVIQQTYDGPGLIVQGGTNTGDGAWIRSQGGNGSGLYVAGNTGGSGLYVQSGANNNTAGIYVQSTSATNGDAIKLEKRGTGLDINATGLYTMIKDSIWKSNFGTMYNGTPTVRVIDSAAGWGRTGTSALTKQDIGKVVNYQLYGPRTNLINDSNVIPIADYDARVNAKVDTMGAGVIKAGVIEDAAFTTNKFAQYGLTADRFNTNYYPAIGLGVWSADTASYNSTALSFGAVLSSPTYVQGSSNAEAVALAVVNQDLTLSGGATPSANNIAGRLDMQVSSLEGGASIGPEPWRIAVTDTSGGSETPVTGARISIRNSTNTAQVAYGTTSTGGYVMFAVDTGSYYVSASVPGMIYFDQPWQNWHKTTGTELDTLYCYSLSVAPATGADSCAIIIYTDVPYARAQISLHGQAQADRTKPLRDTSNVWIDPGEIRPWPTAGVDGVITTTLIRTSVVRPRAVYDINIYNDHSEVMAAFKDVVIPDAATYTLTVGTN
jgi:hypothetical protein